MKVCNQLLTTFRQHESAREAWLRQSELARLTASRILLVRRTEKAIRVGRNKR